MSGKVVIGGNAGGIEDEHARYTMPGLVTKVESSGNGVKTLVVNMNDIAKALHVDPKYPTKYFGLTFGAQTNYDTQREAAVVNGRHGKDDFAKALDNFIKQYVLCVSCKSPDTRLVVHKKNITLHCGTCGAAKAPNGSEKLDKFIIRNPPATKETTGVHAGKNSKGGKKKKKKKDKRTERKSEADSDEEEVVWHTDNSEEAQKKRMDEMKSRGPKAQGSQRKELVTPEDFLQDFIARGNNSIQAITGELRRLQLSRGLEDADRVKVLLGAILDPESTEDLRKVAENNSELFSEFTKDNPSSLMFMMCFEALVGNPDNEKLLKLAPELVLGFYENEVLTENQIFSWHESPLQAVYLTDSDTAVKVRKAVKPLIDWLKEAEEEEDEEE